MKIWGPRSLATNLKLCQEVLSDLGQKEEYGSQLNNYTDGPYMYLGAQGKLPSLGSPAYKFMKFGTIAYAWFLELGTGMVYRYYRLS